MSSLLRWVIPALLVTAIPAWATNPYAKVSTEVNEKLVKLFGAGGFRGAESFGSGIIVSPRGHILTAAAPLLDGRDLRLHLPDGRKYAFKVKVIEPEFDAAILEIVTSKDGAKSILPELILPYFDVGAEVKVQAQPGDWVLAFSNLFNVATRDEMMSVQRATVTAIGKLSARRGAFDVPYHGDVLYLDTVTNNSGSAGGALVNRQGRLVGMIGKEYRNNQTDTWVNYAMPLNSKAEVLVKGEKKTFTLAEFVNLAINDKWIKSDKKPESDIKAPRVHTGIIMVPKVVERTPPYIEEVEPGSPAALAGFKPDDLIIYLDGEPVPSTEAWTDLLKRYLPGDKVQIEIRRGERLTALNLNFAPLPKR